MSDWIKTTEDVGGEAWDRTGTVQGVYRSKKLNVGPNGSNMYMIDTGGKMVGVWGSAVLDSRLAQVPVGSEVKIKSLGKTKSEKTGREYVNYEVEYRPTPFMVAGEQSSPSASYANSTVSEDEPPVESREPQGDGIPF